MCSSRNINEGNLSSLLLATNKRWRKFKSASSWTLKLSCNGKTLTPKQISQSPEGAFFLAIAVDHRIAEISHHQSI